MFKKWKEKDNDKDKKEKKDASKREANRGKDKKSFGDVLAGFENISNSAPKEKGVFGFAARRTQSEKRRKDDEASAVRRDLRYKQQVSTDSGGKDFSPGVNGKVNRSLSGREAASFADKNEVPSERRPSGKSKVEVSISSVNRYKRESSVEARESIKVASGSEVTVNIGLGSEIMAGLGNGTREFLISKAANDEKDSKIQGVDLHLPELKIVGFEAGRVLKIKRRPIGDFGFALRRSTYLGDKSKIIHLAEALGEQNDTGLMPGDRLVEVNGLNVENATREQIIDMISSSGDEVALKVVPVPELVELSKRTVEVDTVQKNQVSPGSKGFSLARSGSMRNKRSKTKSEADLASEKAWLDAEKIWLNHSEGFSAGRLLKRKNEQENPDEQTCLVKLDHGGEVLEVEEEQIAKANPPQYDRAEDLASLRHLNESACLHTLRQRFGSNLIHTYGGPNLMVINPREELGIYSDKVINMFRGCKQEDMPPHIYAMAQTSYRNMQAMRMDQSIILLGRSGSGKTTNLKHLVHYYTSATSSTHSSVSAQKMEAAFCLLDAFGTAKSYLCDSASRFSLLLTLEYDLADLLIGASLQTYLLEKTRVTKRQLGESSFKIFYDLLLGCDDRLRKELYIDPALKDDNNFINIAAMDIDRVKCVDRWMELQFALEALDISAEEAKGLWAPIAAIFHLGAAGISTGNSSGVPGFANQPAAQRAANALGTTEAELSRIIFSSGSPSKPRQPTEKLRTNSDVSDPGSQDASQVSGDIYYDALEGFAMGLYVETFSAIIRLINRCISTSSRVSTTLQILDSPGFQDPISVHPKSQGATFEDLCYNYACEKLHWFLHFATFTSQLDRYNRENIDCNFEVEDAVPPNATLAALDKLNMDRRAPYAEKNDPRGIFWIIEDEAMRSSASDVGLVEKIIMQHGFSKDDSMVKPGEYSDTFKLAHLQKTVDVTYCTNGWLRRVKEHPTIKIAYTLLAESKKPHVADLYVGHRSGVLQVEIARTRSVKKRSAHGPTIPAIKKNSACMLIKMQMDTLLETLRRTNCRFVHCFLPDVNAGVSGTMPKSPGPQKTPNLMLNVPLLRKQFRSCRVLQGIRMHRQGYPEFMAFGEFRRRFDILLPRNERHDEPVLDEKQVVEKMVEHMELDKRSYRIGLSQIFFRSGSLPQLEDARDEKLNDTVVQFQSLCRGFIGRRQLKQLRVQLIAITCLQRNVRKYMAVKNWAWWKLYAKVAPLLDVHRTEEELKSKTGELGLLKNKLEKLENENKELVILNGKLKKKVGDLTVSISQIQSSVSGTHDLLEHEAAERIRLEEELEQLKEEHEKLTKEHDHVHTELLEAKVAQPLLSRKISTFGNDEDDSSEDDSLYKEKYKALSVEVQNLREKLLHEVEEDIETLTTQKRQAEKQLAEEQEEAEDLRKQLANSKRKFGKFNEEMEDMKLILETSHIRNAELEKKQRKFDQQMNVIKDELQQEKTLREDAQRDKDVATTNKFALENEFKEKEEELSRLQKQLERFQNELSDVGATTGDSDILSLKRDRRDLELKVHDQEEELDEQAGQIQMLEQAKLRLEMASQRDKQQFQRDLENKDDEIEEMRSDNQKKMRQLQEQIEEEYKEKNDAVKMRRELERKVFELQHSNDLADRGSEKKLRKELKRLRILYKDAKYALENQASQNTDKAQLKQLRNQLEDIEFAKHIAVKSKKQLEGDMEDLQKELEEMTRSKQEVDDRNIFLSRENAEILSKIEDGEDEVEELLKKNKQQNSQISTLENELVEKNSFIQALTAEKDLLDSKVQQLTTKLSYYEETTVDRAAVQRLEAKVRELESKLDLESTLKSRLEQQVTRVKTNIANLQDERDSQTTRESRMKGEMSKCQRQVKEMKEEVENFQKREDEQKRRRETAESEIENLEQSLTLLKTEQNLSSKRIRDLQEALEHEMMASSSDEDDLSDFDSDTASVSSRFSASGKRSLDRRSGHYDRSTRLRRRLTALEDEPSTRSLPRKTSAFDSDFGDRRSRKGSRDSRSSMSGRTSSMDGYGMLSSRYLNGSLDS